jgi:hypothetical protein
MRTVGVYRCAIASAILAKSTFAAQITKSLTNSMSLLHIHEYDVTFTETHVLQTHKIFSNGLCMSTTIVGTILTNTSGIRTRVLGRLGLQHGIRQAYSTATRGKTWAMPKPPLRICTQLHCLFRLLARLLTNSIASIVR